MTMFNLKSDWPPAGDQPKAIKELLDGIKKGMRAQTLLGVTGSGKTFTMANVIASVGKPTLVIAHNKTLAAQLAQEYKEFFPDNAVHYFVSYYDYYQPEAYMPTTDTYIEKDAQINEEIDRLRHASTQALLTRKDVIIVASVSCIYGLGSPAEYEKENMKLFTAQKIDRKSLMMKLINIHFTRTNADLTPGTFRSIGTLIEIMPVSEKIVWGITLNAQGIESINKVDPVSQKIVDTPISIFIFPAKHFITNEAEKTRAIKKIKAELDAQLKKFEKEGKPLEAERLKRRTTYDLAMIREVGYCNGIENYSRHMSGRTEGSAPDTLLSYFPRTKDGKPDFLTIIDESHVTIPQIGGMYAGDQSRKKTLVEFGFRLPSAMDNRPLRSEEFHERVGQMIFTSATPSVYEKENSEQVVEQVIRPTGLIDPEISIRPILEKGKYPGQIQDFITETKTAVKKGGRVIATTLTKKMAEDLSEYLKGEGIKAEYVHSDIKTLERIQILTGFRKGAFDCLVGVNLLREGLDLPEVTLIGILDADKEGFLRSDTALIQTIGRAARNVHGRVILYAEKITGSIERAVSETNRRRAIQIAYNKEHGITPKTIIKQIKDITEHLETDHMKAVKLNLDIDAQIFAKNPQKLIKLKEKEMSKAVKELDFETAAILRDELALLRKQILE
ncbi:MAG: UvrABC system protein B [Parcubacteria group bacterium GW2011_GWC1_42_11]|uniref:UvrABC system protein B n=1 Tax=Candidatus Nomurabacteria bacterium GW2011_GWC2_42_20 TaxID=1618756 RepID=A0A0G0ZH79_9BACT|nr:MAG: UvrABC system protein B [Parcubacteria group bacterium GW2011_GWC1_42_11]KKS48067.1 MAG: UvrABC system protein B [Candidatus Nomurabacteria bacterium GW2011_GWC2_42_20]KKS59295.1 MAG: UvrABC system protein B [Candidatus Nomurabacteria bacterium GW2011_GWA2_42_41]KKT09607.1 MAG: UvrABC system protein B [Candidatus Nomurabacteria bacterium GW2011_GWB1_43_20]TAN36481.1 MAG: excinuclease ABC subunit UvrB [Patescibacteria group bacterium]HBH71398.1 excinuclease ABC subunit B [Candidatus Yon